MKLRPIFSTKILLISGLLFTGCFSLNVAELVETPTPNVTEKLLAGETIYQERCSVCHGEEGKSELCYDWQSGERIACIGRPLKDPNLLCGDESVRMQALGWFGPKRGFVESAISAGRTFNGMPAYNSQYLADGIGLNEIGIDLVTDYVMSFETEELCQPQAFIDESAWTFKTAADLYPGDPEHGEQLYTITYGCAACHGDPEIEGSNAVAPWSGDFQNLDEIRLEGYTAADYVYESILFPSKHISPECPTGPCSQPSAMPDNYGMRMTAQEIADVMAYLGIDTAESNGIEVIYPSE